MRFENASRGDYRTQIVNQQIDYILLFAIKFLNDIWICIFNKIFFRVIKTRLFSYIVQSEWYRPILINFRDSIFYYEERYISSTTTNISIEAHTLRQLTTRGKTYKTSICFRENINSIKVFIILVKVWDTRYLHKALHFLI